MVDSPAVLRRTRTRHHHPRGTRGAAWSILAAAAVVTALLLPGAGSADPAQPSVTLAVTSGAVSAGAAVAVTGVVSHLRDGVTTVAVLQRTGSRWKKAASAELEEDGSFTARVTAGTPGSWQLVAQYGTGKKKVRSSVVALTVAAVPNTWTAAGMGSRGTAAVAQDGTLWAWGANDAGQLGTGPTDTDAHPVPSLVSTETVWADVAVGDDHTLALRTDGTLWAWGGDAAGQLGLGETTATVDSPAQVGRAGDWAAVAAGRFFSLGIKTDGTLWAWGLNANGQLGLGETTMTVSTPAQVGGEHDWTAVAAGWSHAAAIRGDRTLWTWGFNGNGQLGLGDTQTRYRPTPVIGDVSAWADVSCGTAFTVAVTSRGGLCAWGYNGDGQLGLGDTAQRSVPTRVGTRTGWSAVACGAHHTLALGADETLWAFGWNGRGQLGTAGTTDSTVPVRVGETTGWASAYAGGDSSLGLKADGALFAWGADDDGQLGIGSTEPAEEPTVVGSGAGRDAR